MQQAEVHRIVNDVRVVNPQKGSAQAAKLRDVIKDDLAVRTGAQSRAELVFQDNTLTRLGAESLFSFTSGTRDMSLDQGTMLLQVPKGLGGARIRTAAVTAAITGTTIMLENRPGKHVKVVVLEGSLRLSLNGRWGESVVLHPGKMIIVGAKETRMPKPVTVDLQKLVKTSALVDGEKFGGGATAKAPPLPSIRVIEKEIALQSGAKGKARLAETNLLILGDGTSVTAASTEMLQQIGLAANAVAPGSQESGVFRRGRDSDSNGQNGSNGSGRGNAGTGEGGGTDGGQAGEPGPGNSDGGSNPDPDPQTPTAPPAKPNAPPVTITSPNPYPLTGGKNFDINLLPSKPHIHSGGGAEKGTTYAGASVDGSASGFLFGASSAFDAETQLDSRFGTTTGASPTNGAKVFRFSTLEINGTPIIRDDGSPTHFALIAEDGIHSSSAAATLSPADARIHSLFLGTVDGPITLGNSLTISAPAVFAFKSLHLYGRGSNGTVTIDARLDTPGTRLLIDAQKEISIGSAADLQASLAAWNSAGDLTMRGKLAAGSFDAQATKDFRWNGALTANGAAALRGDKVLIEGGTLSADTLAITAASDLLISGSPSLSARSVKLSAGSKLDLNAAGKGGAQFDFAALRSLELTGKEILLSGTSLNVPAGATATLTTTGGSLDAHGADLTGISTITVTGGDLLARNLGSDQVNATTGKVETSGDLRVRSLTAAGDLIVNGMITAASGAGADTLHQLSAKTIRAGGGLKFDGRNGTSLLFGGAAPGDGGQVELQAEKFTFSTGEVNGATLDGGNADMTALQEGGSGGTLNVGSESKPIPGEIRIEAPITANTGSNSLGVAHGGTGGKVKMVSADKITVASTVRVSDSTVGRASRAGGNITLDSRKTSGTAIEVQNSGQLYSLLQAAAPGPGGKVEFISAGGDITVNGGTLQADKGTVSLTNNGAGNVSLSNATLRGEVVKANVLGANGQLIIGGGTIDANSAIKLYASGANGTVRFNDNVSLSGSSVKTIAGNTVTIDNGKTVTINGTSAANVHTNNPNYTGSGGNGSTTGTFGGQGATTAPVSSGPGY